MIYLFSAVYDVGHVTYCSLTTTTMTSQYHSLRRHPKHSPIDGFPTSTSKLQQETEKILLEHGLSDDGVLRGRPRLSCEMLKNNYRPDIAEEFSYAVSRKEHASRLPSTICFSGCEPTLAVVLDPTGVQCVAGWVGSWKSTKVRNFRNSLGQPAD